jgi:hypothetical protein
MIYPFTRYHVLACGAANTADGMLSPNASFKVSYFLIGPFLSFQISKDDNVEMSGAYRITVFDPTLTIAQIGTIPENPGSV